MTRPLPILVALAISSPALLAVAEGGLGVDSALLRLLLALVVCGVVDGLVRAWWPDPPPADDAEDDAGASPAPGARSGGATAGGAGDRRRRPGTGTGRTPAAEPIHARRRTDVPAP